MRSNRLALAVLAVLLVTLPFTALGQESVSRVKPGRSLTKKHTKRTITNSAVIDLCDLANVRPCAVWNQTDVAIAVKYVTDDADCSGVTITPASDTDITLVPPGAVFADVINIDHTLCGIAVAPVNSGFVYTIESETVAPMIVLPLESGGLDVEDDGGEILTVLGGCPEGGAQLTDADGAAQDPTAREYLVTCEVETCFLCDAATCASPDGFAILVGQTIPITPDAGGPYACRSAGSAGRLRMHPRL